MKTIKRFVLLSVCAMLLLIPSSIAGACTGSVLNSFESAQWGHNGTQHFTRNRLAFQRSWAQVNILGVGSHSATSILVNQNAEARFTSAVGNSHTHARGGL